VIDLSGKPRPPVAIGAGALRDFLSPRLEANIKARRRPSIWKEKLTIRHFRPRQRGSAKTIMVDRAGFEPA
jgi:hypothetical protein